MNICINFLFQHIKTNFDISFAVAFPQCFPFVSPLLIHMDNIILSVVLRTDIVAVLFTWCVYNVT